MQAELRKKILVFIDWYLPGFKAGGPIRSCANLVQRMEHFFHFKIVTGDTDLGAESHYPNIRLNEWNKLTGGEEVFYCTKSFLTHAHIQELIQNESPDVIYLNSMFSQWYTLAPLIAAKKYGKARVVIAPRGMLSPGALGIKSGKKKLFLGFSRVLRLFDNVTWHASTELEVAEVKKMFGNRAHVIHAMNLTPLPDPPLKPGIKTRGSLKLVYIGRVSPVKNTLQVITSLKTLSAQCTIELLIYGPDDDPEYHLKCQQAASTLPPNITVTFEGPVLNERIRSILQEAHFLFLLSFNENFGHAIAESLIAGRPVIISDRTPWRNLESIQCGWDLDLLDDDAIANALRAACSMEQTTYNDWCSNANSYALDVIGNSLHLEKTKQLFS